MRVDLEAVSAAGSTHARLVESAHAVAKGVHADGRKLAGAVQDGSITAAFDTVVEAFVSRFGVIEGALELGARGLERAEKEYRESDERAAATGRAHEKELSDGA